MKLVALLCHLSSIYTDRKGAEGQKGPKVQGTKSQLTKGPTMVQTDDRLMFEPDGRLRLNRRP